MALLDGTYEVINRKALGEKKTQFEATAPDGSPVRIIWYEITTEQEQKCESYRRTLKQLNQLGLAALYDIVSRPGAHYAVWKQPQSSQVKPDAKLLEKLDHLGLPPKLVDVRLDNGHMRIYDVSFDGQPSPIRIDPSPIVRTPSRSFPGWVTSWSVSLILALIAIFVLMAGFNRRTNYEIVIVPDLIGLSLQQAIATLQDSGLGLIANPVTSLAPENTILKMKPSVGDQIRPGRTIHVTFALPAEKMAQTKVPDLIGLMFPNEVTEQLLNANLVLGSVARIPQNIEAGIVTAQRLTPGESIGRDQAVDVLISDGPLSESTFIPKLTGLHLQDALFLAELAGFTSENILIDRVASGSIIDLVVSQSLPPYRPIPLHDSRLRLIVTNPPAPETLPGRTPNLIGLSEEAARKLVHPTQLTIGFLQNSDLPEGIIDLVPAPGSPVEDIIDVQINLPPIEIPKPILEANNLQSTVRALRYEFIVEPGIPQQLAEVRALSLEGKSFVVLQVEVQGGNRLAGEWRSTILGPITFQLRLNGELYAESRVNP